MGGPDIGRQFIEAGLVDEIGVHLVPVLFGSGTRMFEHLGAEHGHEHRAGLPNVFASLEQAVEE
jgi:dihydrofolate reductase